MNNIQAILDASPQTTPTFEELAELLAGILAAPTPEDEAAWLQLVRDADEPALDDALLALAATRRATTQPEQPDAATRLELLRSACADAGVDGFVITRADEHQGEYVPARAERLSWLTGFTGSAGICAVLPDRAAVRSDGRYTLQLSQQVDTDLYDPLILPETLIGWLSEHLEEGQVLGLDPWLHTPASIEKFTAAAARAGATIKLVDANLVDAIWETQPPAPLSPVRPHPIEYAGLSATDKLATLSASLRDKGSSGALLSAPEATAWLLNIRGGDVPFTPLSICYAIVDATRERVHLFIDQRKLGADARDYLTSLPVTLHDYGALTSFIQSDALGHFERISLDVASASHALERAFEGASIRTTLERDPTALPRAAKNETEREGTRRAHTRDGVAVCEFLCWLDAKLAADEPMDEITASEHLLACRRKQALFMDRSFPSISGFGPNGAIVHYRATPESNLKFGADTLYLIDSGAQYLDGTTDITRTIAVGTPTAQMRRHFTLVLKGHISLGMTLFPKGTNGGQLDVLARWALWQAGLDYGHGTGHGVGSYLSVHEGPQRVSPYPNDVALVPGMIVSNEPGYYLAREYGIRIENLIMVRDAAQVQGGDRPMYSFEDLTLAPIDRRLIDTSILSEHEHAWIDRYHARVFSELSDLVSPETKTWLEQATAPL